MKTYISLFSSAGVGCYGFKIDGFECIATNEYIERRLNVQRFNNKCKYDTGYICGDITSEDIKQKLYDEIAMFKKKEKIKQVDVVIATPPCQGMSVANHKKSNTEIVRNSLVIESIKIIKQIHPLFFVFENVPAFMKTICTDIDGKDKAISEAIEANLGKEYSYISKVINFKNYGACSSRSRTVVIGVRKEITDEVSPIELFPSPQREKTLREVIGDMRALTEFGEISAEDIYHAFREYPKEMRTWIHDLKEGQSAFDNEDDSKKPHKIIDGKIVLNANKNGDKYTRQCWDRVGPCVHTRNDQLASQNTIHPSDDRVFSIRELMKMMTIPSSFKWSEYSMEQLNGLSFDEKKAYLKKEEIKIRQSLGEAVPTIIFNQIAKNISKVLDSKISKNSEIVKIVGQNDFTDINELLRFINENPLNLSISALGRVAELSNTKRTDDGAFYTNKSLITEMMKYLPDIEADTISILEPSAGVGNFVPLLLKRYEGKTLNIDLVDINGDSKLVFEALFSKYTLPDNCHINYITDDFLTHKFDKKYDLVVGNPPFYKMSQSDKMLKVYRANVVNKNTTNICSYFLEKALKLGDFVSIVFPKFILNTPEFKVSREILEKKSMPCIIDFGENGFSGVLIETIALFVNNKKKPSNTLVVSTTNNSVINQKQKHITDPKYPYWLIYRDETFDRIAEKLLFNVFTVFRDRQLTKSMLKNSGAIRVLKSRNINDDGTSIVNIEDYDSYMDENECKDLAVYKYLNAEDVYLTPNMTYNPRVMKKPSNTIVNGSVAILIPKTILPITETQLRYFSTDEYRHFYKIARNYQTRSLNVDTNSVFFFGLLIS